MQCNKVDLLAFHDDELPQAEKQEVQLHLNSCQSCQQELGSIDSTMALLGQFWSRERASCPSTEKLVEYHERSLGTQPTEAVHEHLEDCPDCTRLVELLDHLGEGPTVEDLNEAHQPLPPRVQVALEEVRRESLSSRLKKTLETVVAGGKEHLKNAPGVVSHMVDDLLAPREPDASPSLAAPKNAAEVKPREEDGETGRTADGETGETRRRGDKGKG